MCKPCAALAAGRFASSTGSGVFIGETADCEAERLSQRKAVGYDPRTHER